MFESYFQNLDENCNHYSATTEVWKASYFDKLGIFFTSLCKPWVSWINSKLKKKKTTTVTKIACTRRYDQTSINDRLYLKKLKRYENSKFGLKVKSNFSNLKKSIFLWQFVFFIFLYEASNLNFKPRITWTNSTFYEKKPPLARTNCLHPQIWLNLYQWQAPPQEAKP